MHISSEHINLIIDLLFIVESNIVGRNGDWRQTSGGDARFKYWPVFFRIVLSILWWTSSRQVVLLCDYINITFVVRYLFIYLTSWSS